MKNSYKITVIGVVITQSVKGREGEGCRRMVSFALSLQAWCLPSTNSGTTNLRAVFLKVWPVAHLHQNHQKCLLSSMIPSMSLRRVRDLCLQLALPGSDASKV